MDDRDDEHEPGIPLEFLTRPYSKKEIEEMVQNFINTYLEQTDSGTLYIFFKQVEYGVKIGVDYLRDQAFDSFGYYLGGALSGKVQGHDVLISYPREWRYSSVVYDLRERQKEELAEIQEYEKAAGIAKQVPGKGKITVTLRGK